MLRFLRRNARSWIMYIILGIIIFVFVLYFGSTRDSRGGGAIVEIDNTIISEADFYNEYSKLLDIARLRYGAKLTTEELKKLDLKKMAFESLLTRQIIKAKAADLKVQVSDNELKKFIMSQPSLQTEGVFDERKYQQLLRHNKATADEFENLQRIELTASKIEALIRDGIKISDQELLDVYTLQNQKINLHYLQISEKDVTVKTKPTESDLEGYLKNNENRFRIPAQFKVSYLFFSGEDYAPRDISEEDIRSYYNRHKDAYKAKDGKPLSLDDAKGAVLKDVGKIRGMQQAYTVAKKAHETIYQEENFENYAAKNKLAIKSVDFFPLNRPPQEFAPLKDLATILSDLQKNEISKVLLTDKGYYLIKVLDKKAAYLPKLADIRTEVEKSFLEQERQALAKKEAELTLERLKKGEDMGKIAQEKKQKVNETGFFLPGNKIPKLGLSQESTEQLVLLSENKPYPEKPFFIDTSYVIFKFKEKSNIDLKDFESKKDLYRKIFVSLKRDEILQSWLEGNKQALQKEGRLKIKKEAKDL